MKPFDITGVGNAIVDVLSYCDDAFIQAQKLEKGTMTLVDESRSQTLYRMIGPSTECSGGSVANSMAGIASLGTWSARALFCISLMGQRKTWRKITPWCARNWKITAAG